MVVAVLGAGNMGGALARGWASSGIATGDALRLYGPNRDTVSTLADGTDATASVSTEAAVRGADVVVVAVKPHLIVPVLENAKPFLLPGTLIVSVAAGVRLDTLQAAVYSESPIIRAMPNTPAKIGAAASAFCRGRFATDDHAESANRLFGAVGVVVEVTEPQLDAVIGVAGSGVAYFYLLIESLIDGGVRMGLPRDKARILAAQTVLGAARMVLETGEHPAVLKDAVTTPGGTTIAALASLEKSGVRGAMIGAVEAAVLRARELGG